MANILLTTRCNLRCQYCFAQERLNDSSKHMSMDNVREVIEFLRRSDFPLFRVMGGEPTLHPNFIEILEMALNEGLLVDVLSNTTWSEQCAEFFNRVAPTHLMFLLNIDHPSNYTQKIWGRILRNLEMMRGRSNVTLSFNLFEKEPRGDYILDIAKEYGFKHIRLCLSLPVFNARNSSLPITELPEIAPFVMAFVDKAESLGLSVIFDNAVPLCMFNNEQAGKLLLHGVLDLKRNTHCNPIIDIGPDLSVWSCFCLSSVANRSLRDFNNLTEAKEFYTRIWEVYQGKVYPMAKCADCLYREKWSCQGGCLTYALETDNGQRYQQNTIEHLEGGQAPNNKLSLADAVILRRYDIPYEKYILSNTLTDVEFEVGESLQSILPMLNGSHTAEELAETLIGTSPDSGSLQAFLHDTAKECYPKVFDELVRQGFLKETVC